MTPTGKYIQRLSDLKDGDLARLRRLAGRPLDASVEGFDLFTSIWWPLRAESAAAPRRGPSWLITKLYAAFPIPHLRPDSGPGPTLPQLLGHCEPRAENERERYRARFDALLYSAFSALEPHLRWTLSVVARATAGRIPHARDVQGLDWIQLLDDLSIWDLGPIRRYRRDIRYIWAKDYLNAVNNKNSKGGHDNAERNPADRNPYDSESQPRQS